MNIAIIGGGASGMTAAVAASKLGASVTLFEHMQRLGRKLLITGSGKCNISNTDMDISHFHSGNIDLVSHVLDAYPPSETLAFLEKIGLYIKDRNGYLYPYSEQASAAVDVLRFAVRDSGIDVHIEADVKKIEKISQGSDKNTEGRFAVTTADRTTYFDRVIICAGSCSNRNTGSDGSGYDIAAALGQKIIKPLPALTYLTCEEAFYPSIAGIRTRAVISLFAYSRKGGDERLLRSEPGELQLTKTGISGIPVFNLSCIAIKALEAGDKVTAVIDFLPDISEDDISGFIKQRLWNLGDRSIEEMFIGLLAKPLGICICKRCGLDLKAKCSSITDRYIAELAYAVKKFETKVNGYGDFDSCQTVQGGVDMNEINLNLESKIVSGLYFAGEILDVNGDCGGYNLQWAVSSGICAATEASR